MTREPLTSREQMVADLLVTGVGNRELGQRLCIAEDTAKTHVKNILRKLGVTNRTEAAAMLRDQREPGRRDNILAPIRALVDAAPSRLDCRYAIAGIGERVLVDIEELRRALAEADGAA